MPSISKMNKTELVEAIRTRGGAADMSTRRLELQQQLQQMLNEEAGVEVGGTSSARAETDYQRYTSEMNRASGRKKDLIEYMEKRLGIRAPENATVAQLTNLAMGKIYDLSVAHETDPVGFGKYGSLMVSGGRGESEIAPAGSVAEPDHGRQDYVFDGDIGTLMEERQGESRIPKDGDEERQDHRDHFVGSILKRSPEHDERDDGSDPSAALRSGRATEREAWQPTSPREPPGLRDELGSQLREGEWDEVSEATTPTAQDLVSHERTVLMEVHEDGTRLLGQARATRHKVTQFWPKEWHATCPWEGERITVTFYVSRGWGCAAEAVEQGLREQGFRMHEHEHAHVLQSGRTWKMKFRSANEKEEERVKRQLYLLHAATGHGSVRHLYQALKRRNASQKVLDLAKTFRCTVCEERQKLPPQRVASLEPLPPKWATISADIGHWQNPHTGEHVVLMVIIDEGSRYRVARILSRGLKQTPSAATCIQYLREGWTQYFGNPSCLRLDPAGSFRSQALTEYCDRNAIYLDVIPGEAHWQIGACEQAVKGLKEVMTKMTVDSPEVTTEELLSTAVRTFNQRDMVRGFSPLQHAFGRGVDVTGQLLDATSGQPDELQIENPSGEFARNVARQAQAEKAHSEWQAQQRLQRASNSRGRRVQSFHPGDLVFFWRSQESGKSRASPGSKKGRFLGPARILAMETRTDEAGTRRPGSAVWLVRGRQLLKCAPEQLRHASTREELVEALTEDGQVPWTFTRVAREIGGNQYEDLTRDCPDEAEWRRAHYVLREEPPTRRRIAGKRRPEAPQPTEDEDMEHEAPAPAQRRRQQAPHVEESGVCWWNDIREESWGNRGELWNSPDAAVEVHIDLPDSHRKLKQATANLASYFVGALKKRAVEVSEKRLDPQEREQFKSAKLAEVKNFIAAEAFEALPEDVRPDKATAINMRWILTWKTLENGGKKAKARAVLLGYQDPSYEHRQTTSPVMSRQTRQCFLQMCANKKWRVFKGDVSGAFLQGRPYPSDLFCIPCDEICDAMQIQRGSVTRLRKACYGLVDAPLEWYKTVSDYLISLGLEWAWSDPCLWLWRPSGELRGLISGHVDDFLFGGSDQDMEWQSVLEKIRAKFKWGDWEQDVFTQCGVQIQQTPQGFELSQVPYVEDHLVEIPLCGSKRWNKDQPTSDREKTQLRAALGALSWHGQQVAPHVAAETSLLLSEVSKSTINTIIRTNMLVAHARARKQHIMKIHAFPPQEELCLYAWVDAGSQNRPDGGSTQGVFLGMSTMGLQRGEVQDVSPLSWSSHKIDRACRSPGAAETQAAVNGEDALFYLRYQWSEMAYGQVDVKDSESVVRRVPGCLISDSRNVFDKLNTEVLTIKGAEKRSNIELLAVKASQQQTGLTVRWVHSEAQLANSLTKAGATKELELYYQMGHQWRIVEDNEMKSARRRKQDGLEPLQNSDWLPPPVERSELTLAIFLPMALASRLSRSSLRVLQLDRVLRSDATSLKPAKTGFF
ncbi:Retrovirus-related Pol polyprotein from transposon TNT 1-94 [Symbiodinium microadriaticum]|uniref:Retrovirus-related Pol polyprotein from transposon TNT 1-94 n=1 Tax=Symbiodinium microadriaticum TaxID=2951 RepID=A0A1Q9EEX5_SYMMI|nr:Retrovirus-related Pol polyprotein from transposon TNT 1-94 [Symbiodinium microadriaticum]